MTTTFDGTGPLLLRPAFDGDHGFVLAHWAQGGMRQLERFIRELSGAKAFAWEHVQPALRKSIQDAFFARCRRALAEGQVQMLAAAYDPGEPVGFVALDVSAEMVLYIHIGGELRRSKSRTPIAEELLRYLGVREGWTFSVVSPAGWRLAQRMGLRWRPEEGR